MEAKDALQNPVKGAWTEVGGACHNRLLAVDFLA